MSKLLSNLTETKSHQRGTKIKLSNGQIITKESSRVGSLSSLSSGRGTIKETGSLASARGSVLSVSKSDLATNNKKINSRSKQSVGSRSVLSGVSASNVERRRKRNNVRGTDVMSVNGRHSSLSRISMNSSKLLRSQSEGVLMDCSESIYELKYEEITAFLQAIVAFKLLKQEEKKWKARVRQHLNELLSQRPPVNNHKSKTCYNCKQLILPLFRSRVICQKCQFDVCIECAPPTKNICRVCFQIIVYESKLCGIFSNDHINIDKDIGHLEQIAQSVLNNPAKQTSKPDELDAFVDNRLFKTIPSTTNPSILDSASQSVMSFSMNGQKDNQSMSEVISSVPTIPDYDYGDCGEILLGLSFDFQKEVLQIMVKSCRNLSPIMKNNTSNPFVKVMLLPDPNNENKRRTKTISGTINPEFKEYIRYKRLTYDELMARSIQISVWHYEFLAKDVLLGQVIIKFATHSFENASPLPYKLHGKKHVTIPPVLSRYCGDLNIGIKFSVVDKGDDLSSYDDGPPSNRQVCSTPSTSSNLCGLSTSNSNKPISALNKHHHHHTDGGCMGDQTNLYTTELRNKNGVLSVWLRDACNLLTSKYDKLPNAYVKCVMIPETVYDTKKKTPVIRKNFNPIWNTSMVFTEIPLDMFDSKIEISVWNKRPKFLPDCLLGFSVLDIGEAIQRVIKDENMLIDNPTYEAPSSRDPESEICYRMVKFHGRWIEAQIQLKSEIVGHEITK